MALKLLQAGVQPLGQFDGYDTLTTLATGCLGGEVATLVNYAFEGTTAGTDQAAKDADGTDGYVGAGTEKFRPIVTTDIPSGARPLFLVDEGSTGYGTLFGEIVGSICGKVANVPGSGTRLGPHTAEGSGKVTLWDKPGLYGATLDAVDTTAVTGLTVDNPTLDVGDPLYAFASTGVLTPNDAAAFESVVVARFVEFSTNGSLVTTPNFLVAATNSPSGSVAAQVAFTQAVFHFDPEY
jgi:hypothetical protein